MFGFDLTHLLGFAMLGMGALGLLWTYAGKLLGNVKLPSFGGGVDDNTLDFQALERLQHRFENAKCKEGMDACTVCLTHFFHGQPGGQ